MTDWPVTLLDPALAIETAPPGKPPDPAAAAAIDRIWLAATATDPSLFNGRIFSADRIDPARIVGHWTEYRFAFAQLRDAAATGGSPIRPLAVNGVIRCAGGFVVARRSGRAVYQAGLWQCAPAGSVETRGTSDRVDLASQVAAELEEELGLGTDSCTIGVPLAAVSHPGSGVVDIGMAIETGLDFEAIATRHRQRGNAEYDALALVADDAVEAWIAGQGERIAPPTRVFLRLASVRSRRALP